MKEYAFYHGGLLVGRTLKDHGIEYVFGVHGGHVWPLERGFYEFGLKRLHMRHEQAAAYAADAYSRCTRTPGIIYATNGPGMTNTISGIAQAWWSKSPMVALFGQNVRDLNGRETLQEDYAEERCKGITKWAVVNEEWRLIPFLLRKALYDCMVYPPGPIAIANTPKALLIPGDHSLITGDVPSEKSPAPQLGSCPGAAEEAVKMLYAAQRPMMVVGEGAYWDEAGPELKEIAELANCPINTRRLARGLMPEDHPMHVGSGYRGAFWRECDLLFVIGLRLGFLEAFGEPPAYPPKAERIVVNASASEAWAPVPAKMRIIANIKLFLQDMIRSIKSQDRPAPPRTEWLGWLQQCRQGYHQWVADNVNDFKELVPIHGFVLGKETGDFLDPNATVILDSFTGSSMLTDHLNVRFPGSVLSCEAWAGVGHGIGMGIGAQLARPGKQVLVMMGDGGMGIGGMDIETAVRYNVPVVYVVFNNSDWLATVRPIFFRDQVHHWGMIDDIRYDKMFELMGCYGEYVTKPEEIKPALYRAFNSGKTAVVNVIVHPLVFNHLLEIESIRGMIRAQAEKKKVDPDWWEWLLKGDTEEIIAKLRAKGYPMLRASKVRYRAEQPIYKRVTEKMT